jgi:hypothetical protein
MTDARTQSDAPPRDAGPVERAGADGALEEPALSTLEQPESPRFEPNRILR